MTFKSIISVAVVILASGIPGYQQVHEENWPGWRGPRMDGSSIDTEVPVRWDSTNIRWKTVIPGEGYSSPVIWGDRIFLTSAIPGKKERILVCLDRINGNILWNSMVVKAPLEPMHPDNGYASSTPVTDGKRVFVSFQDSTLSYIAAFDFSGQKIWETHPGIFEHEHGYCSSLSSYKNRVIINAGNRGDKAYVAAFNGKNGQELWRILHKNGDGSYSVPFIREMLGCIQMILCGDGSISSHKPKTGEKIWEIDIREDEFITTPVYHEEAGLLLTCTSYDRRYIRAIRPDCSPEDPESKIKWESRKGGFYVSCPVAIDDYFLTIQYGGYTYCFQAVTGEILWRQKTGKQYSSPVTARGVVYSVNDYGVLRVIKPGPEFECQFQFDFGEKVMASPAICKGELFIRSDKYLYCIGN